MERSLLDKYQPIPDKEPNVTAHVRFLWQDILDDTTRADERNCRLIESLRECLQTSEQRGNQR